MVEFVELEEARARDGLRMTVVIGVPSPWGEAAKGIWHVKKIPWVAVRMPPGENEVTRWTGSTSAPVAMYEDEPPRPRWDDLLHLAERLEPTPPLLPADPDERALCLGLAAEICGEMGLGWCRRLDGIARSFATDGAEGFALPIARYLAPKYGWRDGLGELARRRVIDVLGLLSRRLRAQQQRGSRYYFGGALSAVDVYSATFIAMFAPLPPEHCPMPDALRATFETMDDETRAALDPILVEHRDRVYAEHLELPLTL
jgi:glutathione S-transferase